MSREIYLVRHAQIDLPDVPASIPQLDPSISKDGIMHSRGLLQSFRTLGVVPNTNEPVAVSELLRARQTAIWAGFSILRPTRYLNEIPGGFPTNGQNRDVKLHVPEQDLAVADTLLENQPHERIWFTHGRLIAAVCERAGRPLTQKPEAPSITVVNV